MVMIQDVPRAAYLADDPVLEAFGRERVVPPSCAIVKGIQDTG